MCCGARDVCLVRLLHFLVSQYSNCLILELSIPNEVLKPAAYWLSLGYLKVFNLGLIVYGNNADIVEQCY